MSMLWRLVFFSRCTSTHHKLALDALRFVRGPQAELWANLFLSNHEQYLTGSKAPDNEFRDFKNHVLHVKDGFWGGATTAARLWYQKTVVALSQGDWPEAIYNAGVLSHYFTDPFQPFHTGQTEAEGAVHRAAEWSICKSYEDLQAILEHDLTGYPDYELPPRPDWLEEAIRQGAVTAHESYDVCIDHYDLNRGIKHPPSGLDQESKDRLARLIGLASVGFARVLERAFEESAASPPDVAVSVHAFLAMLKMPLNWLRKKFTDIHERAVIEAIYLEVQEKGKASEALPEDERLVRKLYAQEVLKVPVRQLDAEPARATGTQYGTGTPSRGEPVQPVSSASYQRTVVSKPYPMPIPRGKEAPLETCLMVPLATEPPKDFVADAAVQAYLNPSAIVPDERTRTSRANLQASQSLLAVTEQSPAVISMSKKEPAPQAQSKRPVRPEPVAATLPTKQDLDKQERRLQKRLSRPAEIEPKLVPPSLPASVSSPVAEAEMPVDMFAPLPPAPRVNTPQNTTPQPMATTVAPSAPQSNARQTSVPGKPSITAMNIAPLVTPPATAKPSSPVPHVRAPEPTLRSTPPTTRPGPVNQREAKNFTTQPAESSVVPAPHVRMPEPVSEPTTSEPPATSVRNRMAVPGQTAGFDFRNFSGLSLSSELVAPEAPANRQPPPPSKPAEPTPSSSQPTVPPIAAKPATSRRFYLELESPVVDAPTIGPKTAERLHAITIRTVSDLLRTDAETIADLMGNRAATQIVRDWQDQARMVCCVPNLRGHDAQFLVACGVRSAQQLRASDARNLLQQVGALLQTAAGQRLLRGGTAPDLTEVSGWISAAGEARSV